MKWVFNIKIDNNFHPFQAVGRVSQTQFKVGIFLMWR